MQRAFANLDGLVRLSNTEGVDIRRPLLRVLTDLYVQEKAHTREEEQQYVELTLRLLPAVDAATRLAIARKLAAYRLTPGAVRDALASEAREIAALFAERDRDFEEDQDLEETVVADPGTEPPAPFAMDGASELFAPPPARDSSAAVPAPNVVQPPTPPLVDAAAPPRRLGEAFLRANSATRIDVLFRMDDAAITAAAETLHLPVRAGTSERLEQAARAHNQTDFARELQLALAIPGRIAWRIIQDDSGEPIVVAAKALEVPWDVLVRILLLLNPVIGNSVERVFALARLSDRLTAPSVAPIIASWREEGTARPAARFQPLHVLDAESLAARDARTAPREPGSDLIRRASAVAPRLRSQGTT